MAHKQTYSNLLKHPNWQKKRLKVLEDRNFKCENCADKETSLHVHHKYYEKGKKPWEYPVSAFNCFCKDCHDIHHSATSHFKVKPLVFLKVILYFLNKNLDKSERKLDSMAVDRLVIAIEAIQGELNAAR